MLKTLTTLILAFGFTALAFLFGTSGEVVTALVCLGAGFVSVIASWWAMIEEMD